jgi:hypothetical protein
MADTLELDLSGLTDDDKTPVCQYLPFEIVGFDGWVAISKCGRAWRLNWDVDTGRYWWIDLPRIGAL